MSDLTSYYSPTELGLPNRRYEVQVGQSELVNQVIAHSHLARLALWIMAEIDIPEPSELSVSFVDSSMIKTFNHDYRGMNKATDVLSFSADFEDGEPTAIGQPLALGDIVICPEIADRIDYGADLSLDQKLEILVIHGLLHLVGYDHEDDKDAAVMEEKEDFLYHAWAAFCLDATGEISKLPVSAELFDESLPVHPMSLSDSLDEQEEDGSFNGYAITDTEPAIEQDVPGQNQSIVQSFRWALTGIAAVIRTERNMQIHLAVAILVVALGFILKLEITAWIAIVMCIAFVLAAEMLNTAIEHLVDLSSPHYHPKAKLAKDIAAGTVLVFAIAAVIIGLIIFLGALRSRLLLQ